MRIFPLKVGELLSNISAQQAATALTRAFLEDPVDTSMGKLLANLKASGYQPEQVDEIYITHMHGDHVGGIVADGKLAFPNAVVRAATLRSGLKMAGSAQPYTPTLLHRRKGVQCAPVVSCPRAVRTWFSLTAGAA